MQLEAPGQLRHGAVPSSKCCLNCSVAIVRVLFDQVAKMPSALCWEVFDRVTRATGEFSAAGRASDILDLVKLPVGNELSSFPGQRKYRAQVGLKAGACRPVSRGLQHRRYRLQAIVWTARLAKRQFA